MLKSYISYLRLHDIGTTTYTGTIKWSGHVKPSDTVSQYRY